MHLWRCLFSSHLRISHFQLHKQSNQQKCSCTSVPVCVSLPAAQPSAGSGWAAPAGRTGPPSCLRFRSRCWFQSSAGTPCDPELPARRPGAALATVSAATPTPPPETGAAGRRSAVCRRRRSLICRFTLLLRDTPPYLSLGSQFVKTVRSLLSLKVSQGTSSSSADSDMAFTLSSRLNTLKPQTARRQCSSGGAALQLRPKRSYMSASSSRSSSILSVRTWAKCSDWFSLFLRAMNSGIFSNAPYLYAWMMYSEVCGRRRGSKEAWRRERRRRSRTHIFLIGVEKPEREVTGLRGGGKLTQRLSVPRQQEPAKKNDRVGFKWV